MKRFIGGIIIIAMLSQPGYLVYGAIALQLDNHNKEVVMSILGDGPQLVSEYISKVENASSELCRMIEMKNRLKESIDKKMSQNAKEKKKMSFQQIRAYKQFSSYYDKALIEIRSLLFEIDDLKKLTSTQQEILKTDTNYSAVINELAVLHNKQVKAIVKMNDVVLKGEWLLTVI